MKTLLFTLFFSFLLINLQAQIKIGDNPTKINEGSALEIESSSKGLLLPRVSLKTTNDWGLDGTPVAGMVVYNIATGGIEPNNVLPGYYSYNGSKWISLASSEWYLKSSGLDASGDKTAGIYRTGSVAIGAEGPDDLAILDLSSSTKGFFVPRMTEMQRNEIPVTVIHDGLLIYNTDEGCFNFWSGQELIWKSTCGQVGKSSFTVDCSQIIVHGTYIQGKELTSANYLTVPVSITKEGNYNIKGTTTNGYSFFISGVFLSKDVKSVQVPGQGIPKDIQVDKIQISINDSEIECTPAVEVEVLSSAGTYTMSCGSAIVNGVYKVGVELTTANSITLPINVSGLGSWSITSNTVDGISFSGSGTFSTTGPQNLTIYGIGTPTSTDVKLLTLTSNSRGGVSTTCNVSVVVVIPKKTLLAIGGGEAFGYNFATAGAASNKLITSQSNFGTQITSRVKSEGFTVINGTNNPNLSTLLAQKPDIVVIGYSWIPSSTEAKLLADYIANKGVVLAFSEAYTGMQSLFRLVFNDNTIATGLTNAAGALYSLPITNDGVLNGSFGDVRGKVWGEDASSTAYATNIPANEIIIYSTDADLSQANPGGTAGRVTGFRHKTLNFLWIGDGGFNSNNTLSELTVCPFKLDGNNFPVEKSRYGRGSSTYYQPVINSIFTANAIEWAIKQAEFDGINTK